MKKFCPAAILVLTAGLLVSCATQAGPNQSRRPLNPGENVIGTVQATFAFTGPLGNNVAMDRGSDRDRINVSNAAYIALLEAARSEFRGNVVGVRDVTWAVERRGRGRDRRRFTASGIVVLLGRATEVAVMPGAGVGIRGSGITGALERAAGTVARNFPAGSRIAIAHISGTEGGYVYLVDGRLEHIFLTRGFDVFDRSRLDIVRAEQELGLDFVIDERTAVTIGHITGVSVIITGRVVVAGGIRELQLRALDTTTARLIGSAIESF